MNKLNRRTSAFRAWLSLSPSPQSGFTLLELVITIAILAVLTLGAIPLVKVSVKRQKEQHLRESLREMRAAIDQFHLEAVRGQLLKQVAPNTPPPPLPVDPRIRVGIVDDKIFKTDNLDRYPPDLDTMVQGVNVVPLQQQITNGPPSENRLTSDKKKVYLRKIPVDPMTGEADWELRSSYDTADSGSWGGENVFDVRSTSNETALNGEKYSDW